VVKRTTTEATADDESKEDKEGSVTDDCTRSHA
jgi:hypothetical protein